MLIWGPAPKGSVFVNDYFSDISEFGICRVVRGERSTPCLRFIEENSDILKRIEKGQECIIGPISSDPGSAGAIRFSDVPVPQRRSASTYMFVVRGSCRGEVGREGRVGGRCGEGEEGEWEGGGGMDWGEGGRGREGRVRLMLSWPSQSDHGHVDSGLVVMPRRQVVAHDVRSLPVWWRRLGHDRIGPPNPPVVGM